MEAQKVVAALLTLFKEEGLVVEKYLNEDPLGHDTARFLEESDKKKSSADNVVNEIMIMWLPSLYGYMAQSGHGYNHAFDIDLQIKTILRNCNYPGLSYLEDDE